MTEEQELAASKQRVELAALWEREDLAAVIATAAGRAVLWNLLCACKIYSDGFNGGDHAAMAREAGMRYVGLSLLEKVLTVNSEAYILMRNEATVRRHTLEQRFKPEQEQT